MNVSDWRSEKCHAVKSKRNNTQLHWFFQFCDTRVAIRLVQRRLKNTKPNRKLIRKPSPVSTEKEKTKQMFHEFSGPSHFLRFFPFHFQVSRSKVPFQLLQCYGRMAHGLKFHAGITSHDTQQNVLTTGMLLKIPLKVKLKLGMNIWFWGGKWTVKMNIHV